MVRVAGVEGGEERGVRPCVAAARKGALELKKSAYNVSETVSVSVSRD